MLLQRCTQRGVVGLPKVKMLQIEINLDGAAVHLGMELNLVSHTLNERRPVRTLGWEYEDDGMKRLKARNCLSHPFLIKHHVGGQFVVQECLRDQVFPTRVGMSQVRGSP